MTLGTIAAAMGGRVTGDGADRGVDGFSIDTRTLRPGDLYFAIVGERLAAKLGRVGLAEQDRAGAPDPGHERCILGGNALRPALSARSRDDSAGVERIFHRERNSVERPAPLSLGELGVGLAGIGARRVRDELDDGIEAGVDLLDAPKARAHDFQRRYLLGPYGLGQHRDRGVVKRTVGQLGDTTIIGEKAGPRNRCARSEGRDECTAGDRPVPMRGHDQTPPAGDWTSR